jgi:spore germination protein KC
MIRHNKMKIAISSIIPVFSLLLLSGCAFKDIDKRIFVVAVGIDPSEEVQNGFRVTLKMADPIGNVKQQAAPSYSNLSHDAESVAEAIRDMDARVDKVLEFGHSRMIIMNEKLLSENLDTFLDYFVRRGDIQMISYIAVAENAEEAVSFQPETETPASIALYNFFDDTGTESPFIITKFLFQFRREVLSDGIHTVLPIIEVNKKESEFVINKSIILKRNEEPVKLDPIQTKYLNSLAYQASGFSYKIKEDDLLLVLNIDEVKMKYEIILDDGPPRIDMKITKVGVVGEANKRLDIKHLKKYDAIVAKDTKAKALDLLKTLQKNDVDPFGFGLRYRATRFSHDGIIDDWNRIYPEIEFNVTMDIRLRGTGTIE